MTRLPLTVIGGYLGAGKTTVLNRLLTEDHGLRLMVMVNDFGAVNIDAALLASASGDTIELSNGCVCCTMGADLFMAIGDVLDRPQRPDHLLIEASGVADPAAIAQVALTEPDLAYGGVVTVIDGLNWDALSRDALVGAQVSAQAKAADLRLLTKTAQTTAPLKDPYVVLNTLDTVAQTILGLRPVSTPTRTTGHAAYATWDADHGPTLDAGALHAHLQNRPDGLFRVKGFVDAPGAHSWEIHCVGAVVDIKPTGKTAPQVVGIGLASRFDTQTITDWWSNPTA